MWRNFLVRFSWRKPALTAALLAWVCIGFAVSQLIVLLAWQGIQALGWGVGVNGAVLNTTVAAVVYVLTMAFVIGLPWLIFKRRTTRADLALTTFPTWLDIILAPTGFVVYVAASALLLFLAGILMPWIDLNQVQDTGFSGVTVRYEYILAFVTLVVIAPVAEEILFRGYLFGKLLKHVPVWVAVLLTSAVFAAIHGAWNVAIDVFALSIVLCIVRLLSKSLWPAILLHMIKNGIAFYLLFINPAILNTLGG
jgi:membrane protease YdiL (CAAX protease family)